MRSYRKLLVSALVSATLCSHITQAVSNNAWICGGVASFIAVSGVASAIVLGIKNCSANTRKEAFNKRAEAAKKEVIKYIGAEKYEVLCKIGKRAKFDFSSENAYSGIDPDIVKKIILLRHDDGLPNRVSELSGDPLSLFLGDTSISGKERFWGISLEDVKGIIGDSFSPICGDLPHDIAIPWSACQGQDENFGDGVGFCNYLRSGYSIFVSNDNNLVKICYYPDANCNEQFTFVLNVSDLL